MKKIEIVIVATDVASVRVWGEVKAVEMAGMPTVAHAEATRNHCDVFNANPGRLCYQFRTSQDCHVTLSHRIDGVQVGPPTAFDCTEVNSGLRYNFEVPS